MASQLYTPYKVKRLNGTAPDLSTVTVKAALIDVADYTFSAAHEFWSSVAGAAVVGTPVALAGKAIATGVFDANDTTIVGVSGDGTEAVILYVDTGVAGTSQLLAYFDGTSVEVTPNGEDINIRWHANGIFSG